MRFPGRGALFGLAVGLSVSLTPTAADEPAPLLKPAAPPAGQVRVRIPVEPGFPKTVAFSAQVPHGKNKQKRDDVVVAFDAIPGPSYITVKKLESLGYDRPNGKEFVLPELTIPAAQVAPKAPQGHDVVVKLTNLKLTVINNPASADDSIYLRDFSLSSATLFGGAERAIQPRLHFGDEFLEVTLPASKVKASGTGDLPLPEVKAGADAKLAAAFAPTVVRSGRPVLAYAAVNGQSSFKLAGKQVIPVDALVSSITNTPDGVIVTLGLARGCNVEMEGNAGGMAATGTDVKSTLIPGKIKELRLGVYTGKGLREQKDIVIKDLPVSVDKNESQPYMLLGQKFIDAHFAEGVYAGDSTGWKLHGRVNPDLLDDIKNRGKQGPKK